MSVVEAARYVKERMECIVNLILTAVVLTVLCAPPTHCQGIQYCKQLGHIASL